MGGISTTIRKIVQIDEEKCDGCGLCVPSCAEGAIQIIDGKALVNEKFCDGLGACLGECPQDAITIVEREAELLDEKAAGTHPAEENEKVVEKVTVTREAQETATVSCPSCSIETYEKKDYGEMSKKEASISRLTHWPIQLKLTPPQAPFFKDAHLLVAADCVPFAYADFHEDFIKGKTVVIGCPKLDDVNFYVDRLTDIFNHSDLRSVTVVHMDVACCSGIMWATKKALDSSGKQIPLREETISAKEGKIVQRV